MINHQISLAGVVPVEELEFEPLDARYRNAQIIGVLLVYVLFMCLAAFLLLADCFWIFIVAECILALAAAINAAILPKAFRYKGYALRDHDISYKSGMIFPKTTTVPFARVQQVSVGQNPVSRFFRLYSVEVVNGAQALSSLKIPGLTEETANRIKNLVTEKLRNCDD